ncbi:cytochrome P450 [Aspergillus pseudoustus]|uniref:Cytochrome P450 n=1 Tax=Aspergillus pseudoustus TaxID=1810923 RepID=A0ABR4JWB6_9EURO
MLLQQLLGQWPALITLCGLGVVARLFHNKYGHGIAEVPGPFLAAYTDLWRFCLVWGGRPEKAHIKLHERYGPLVRLGPNMVSVSDPAALKVVYGLSAGYVKSGFYPVQQQAISAKGDLLQGMFNTTDEKYHARLRRSVNNAYAMSSLVHFEPLVDSTTVEFLKQLTERYADKPDQICDFGKWLQFYAFDVIGELTFSKRLGFVDRGVDVDNIISDLERALFYFSVVGQIPALDKLLLKNPVRIWFSRMGFLNATSPVAIFAKTHMAHRLSGAIQEEEEEEEEKKATSRKEQPTRRDFLSRFLEAGQKDPAFITPERVLSLTSANVFAGSDTTAISLRTIFYYLLKTPDKLKRLMRSIEEAEKTGLFTREDKLVRWAEANELPYLGAVIKEGLRIHPAAGLPLERIVPKGGATLSGQFVPPGTIVGISAWTLHRNAQIFGDDVDTFRPERWLDDPEKAAVMNQFLFSFGGGARTCAGKNVSYLEMYKLVPAILRTFDIQLADPNKEWHLSNRWFVKQSDFYKVYLYCKAVSILLVLILGI